MRLPLTLLLPALVFASFASSASAQSITWGNIPGHQIVDSKGAKLTESWQFELGVFLPGFYPTQDNIADWVANWMPIDKADFNAKIGYFSSRAAATEPQAAGLQAYIWIYNARKYDSESEWLLITDRDGNHSNDWMVPNRSDDPTAAVIDWRVSRATTVLMGGTERLASKEKGDADAIGKKRAGITFNTGTIPEKALIAAAQKADKAEPTAIAGEVEQEFTE